MSANIKALIFVLAIATLVFRFAKPIALRFSAERDFLRRRNIWLALTATAFLSPNFWLFTLICVPLLTWGGRKDSNAAAFYLALLLVIPSIPIPIPTIGINELFDLDIFRLLSFCVLLPAAWNLLKSRHSTRIRKVRAMDTLLLAFGVLEFIIFVRPDLPNHVILKDSPTAALRRLFLFMVDVYTPYFVVSRCCWSRERIVDAMAAFCLSGALMAPIAVYETLHHWLLYAEIPARWSTDLSMNPYLFRGGDLRAQASAGHALTLGYLLAVAIGFWLYLQYHVKLFLPRLTVALLLSLGLLASYSRGPWLTALSIYFVFASLGQGAFRRLFKAAIAAAVSIGAILVSPLGDKIIRILPFMGGSVDSGSIVYRQQLARRSWQLIQEHPFFGDQFVYSKMADLRQGQGIIDLVNTYAQMALFYGVVGLCLFLSFFLLGIYRVHRLERTIVHSDVDLARLGTSLIACMIGTLVMIATASFGLGTEKLYYVLTGLAAAYYSYIGSSPQGHAMARTDARTLESVDRMALN